MPDNPIADVLRSTGVPALVDTTRDFVEKLFGPAIAESGELFRDLVRSWRWRNQVRILQRAHELSDAANLNIEAVPLRTLVPLLEGAGLEEDPTLQDMWASLLASAAGKPESSASRPAFVDVMKQISPVEAWILSERFVQYGYPRPTERPVRDLAGLADASGAFGIHDLSAGLTNLTRLGLVAGDLGLEADLRRVGEALTALDPRNDRPEALRGLDLERIARALKDGRRSAEEYHLTALGFQFLYSVLPPKPRPVAEPWSKGDGGSELVGWHRFARAVAVDFSFEPDLAAEFEASAARTAEELDRRKNAGETLIWRSRAEDD